MQIEECTVNILNLRFYVHYFKTLIAKGVVA